MAITNYSTLKTAISDWLDRDDLTAEIDTFIDMMEAQLYRELRIEPMETALSVTLSSGVGTVPTSPRFLSLKFAYVDGSPTRALELKSPGWIYENYPLRSSSSKPSFIARERTNFIFGPFPDSDYTIKGTYYAPLTALSSSNETNFFTDNAPDLLLFGALIHAAVYVGDDESAIKWKGQWEEQLRELDDQDRKNRWGEKANLTISVR